MKTNRVVVKPFRDSFPLCSSKKKERWNRECGNDKKKKKLKKHNCQRSQEKGIRNLHLSTSRFKLSGKRRKKKTKPVDEVEKSDLPPSYLMGNSEQQNNSFGGKSLF